jgi:hypothetical protein
MHKEYSHLTQTLFYPEQTGREVFCLMILFVGDEGNMSTEDWWVGTGREKLNYSVGSLSECYFFHHKSNECMWTGVGSYLGLCSKKLCSNN